MFREHGLYQCRGFDVHGKHYNRAFRTKRLASSFLAAMRSPVKSTNVEHY